MDLIMTYKIINGLVDVDIWTIFLQAMQMRIIQDLMDYFTKVDLTVIQESLVFRKELSMIGIAYPTM